MALAIAIYLLLVGREGLDAKNGLLLGALILGCYPLDYNFFWAQSQVIVLALIVSAMRAMEDEHDGAAGPFVAARRAAPRVSISAARIFCTAAKTEGAEICARRNRPLDGRRMLSSGFPNDGDNLSPDGGKRGIPLAPPFPDSPLLETGFLTLLMGYTAAYWFAVDSRTDEQSNLAPSIAPESQQRATSA